MSAAKVANGAQDSQTAGKGARGGEKEEGSGCQPSGSRSLGKERKRGPWTEGKRDKGKGMKKENQCGGQWPSHWPSRTTIRLGTVGAAAPRVELNEIKSIMSWAKCQTQ